MGRDKLQRLQTAERHPRYYCTSHQAPALPTKNKEEETVVKQGDFLLSF